jgi:hypothetical protein
VDHLAGGGEAVDRSDARVDEGHVHAMAGVAGVPVGVRPVHGGHAVQRVDVARRVVAAAVQVAPHVGGHLGDARCRCQCGHGRIGNRRHQSVDERDAVDHGAAEVGDGSRRRILLTALRAHDHRDQLRCTVHEGVHGAAPHHAAEGDDHGGAGAAGFLVVPGDRPRDGAALVIVPADGLSCAHDVDLVFPVVRRLARRPPPRSGSVR